MIDILIDISQLETLFDRLGKATRNTAPLMKDVADLMFDAVEENFVQQGRPQWLGLKSAKRRAENGKILHDKGDLQGSLTRYSDAQTAVVGSKKRYAAIHQFGGYAGRGRKVKIDARPYLNLMPDDEDKIIVSVSDYLRGVIEK